MTIFFLFSSFLLHLPLPLPLFLFLFGCCLLLCLLSFDCVFVFYFSLAFLTWFPNNFRLSPLVLNWFT